MSQTPNRIEFSPAVRAQQERMGSRASYERREAKRGFAQEISDEFASFISTRESFYLGTADADGQPYIQHRGGPAGFLRVLDGRTLGFADYKGNRQYISIGNLSENPRAFLFLMDYETATRFKVWGRAEFVEDDPELLARLTDPAYGEAPERAMIFHVDGWDKNCRQHIPHMTRSEAG